MALLVLFCNASNVEFMLLDVGGRRSLLLLVEEMFDSVTSEAPGVGVSVSVESSFPVVVSTSDVLLVTMLLSVTLLLTGTSETLTSTASDCF